MKKIYCHESFVQVHHIKNVLEASNIRCHVENDMLSSLAGEIPSTECWPEIWLDDINKEGLALSLIDNSNLLPSLGKWACTGCEEIIEEEFDICWQCGAIR